MRGLLLILGGWLLIAGATAWAYEEVQVTDGGAVSGKVTITAGKPIPKGFNLVTFPDPVYCGRISTGTGWRILKEFDVADDGGLKDTVVWLADASKGKPYKFEPPTIEARDCRFLPFDGRARSIRRGYHEHGPGHARHSSLRDVTFGATGPVQYAASHESAP